MSARRAADATANGSRTERTALTSESSAFAQRRNGPSTMAEAEEEYVAARDAWTAAMRAAASGAPRDLASLAIAQEAYEAATIERERWLSGQRVETPADPEPRSIDAVVGQELAWRRVHDAGGKRDGMLRRLAKRLSGR